ncbi:hypothetical protein NBT05_17370 [Aquimarina sp. ERC-38]|uniref:hypothetical protein n=1 Tax=Aquimarina sp. ERC-38 TaxID=2949996 RepID=UPI0022486371|nr:hypothetical protein [Aquimarina sp. ERC-38]UZO80699.1 hypothetical protein NBT05_17370 [Aquimarina sp. ERC-38]
MIYNKTELKPLEWFMAQNRFINNTANGITNMNSIIMEKNILEPQLPIIPQMSKMVISTK